MVATYVIKASVLHTLSIQCIQISFKTLKYNTLNINKKVIITI